MSNNFKYKKLIKFIHIAYIPRVKSQRRYFIAYHWTIYSPKYGNTFRSVADLWRNTSTSWRLYSSTLQVNHSVHFVDPDTQACKIHIENMWKNAKISHKARCGMQRSLLSSYLQEFMWRQRFGKNSFKI